MQFAPRFPPKLLDVIERLAIQQAPIAEINRRVGAEAERLGLARPSYQRVRVLVHEARDLQRLHVLAYDPLLDVANRTLSRTRSGTSQLVNDGHDSATESPSNTVLQGMVCPA